MPIRIELNDDGTLIDVFFDGKKAAKLDLPKELGRFHGAKAFQIFAFADAKSPPGSPASFDWTFINGQWRCRP